MPHPKGGYKTKDGKKVVGVTTPIGRFKDSGGLLWWAFEQGKSAERGEINSLYDKRDEAADAGTLAHMMVETHIKGTPMPVPSDYDKDIYNAALQGYTNYLEWSENNSIVVVAQEVALVNEEYGYGGCIDGIGYDSKKRRCILDWKNANSIYVDNIIQLAAYGRLWDSANPSNPITGGFHLCRFSKEHADFAHHYWSELDDAWEQFKLFLKAYKIDKKLKKRV
jgi:hypothetical protein